jgi:hypothetical protein
MYHSHCNTLSLRLYTRWGVGKQADARGGLRSHSAGLESPTYVYIYIPWQLCLEFYSFLPKMGRRCLSSVFGDLKEVGEDGKPRPKLQWVMLYMLSTG